MKQRRAVAVRHRGNKVCLVLLSGNTSADQMLRTFAAMFTKDGGYTVTIETVEVTAKEEW